MPDAPQARIGARGRIKGRDGGCADQFTDPVEVEARNPESNSSGHAFSEPERMNDLVQFAGGEIPVDVVSRRSRDSERPYVAEHDGFPQPGKRGAVTLEAASLRAITHPGEQIVGLCDLA